MAEGGCSARGCMGHNVGNVGRDGSLVGSHSGDAGSPDAEAVRRAGLRLRAGPSGGNGREARGPKPAQCRHHQDHQGGGEQLD